MHRLWHSVIRPIIDCVNAKYIIEIGSDDGLNTKNILEYCMDNNARMTAVDPLPKFNINDFENKYKDKFEIYTELSLNRLPFLKDYDVVLLDGDHNWYTIYNELKIIESSFKNKKFPLIFLHDVGWPYGRRDLYYDPDNIPKNYRHPYKKLGIYPDQKRLKKEGGLNSHLYNSIDGNNPKTGVLTALEDFVKESDLEFSFKFISAFFGLGILFLKNDEMEDIVEKVVKNVNLLNILEEERIKLIIEQSELKDQNNKLKSQISILKTNFFEMKYLNNIGRSFSQRLISKFPSSYILFCRKNNGIKNVFINMKGYKAIKNNNLFDIGYYLKNNDDVRLSGEDPILHYMYHGFKEGRKPSTLFDGDYYLRIYGDVFNSKLNPLVHYSIYGVNEGRRIIEVKTKTERKN